MKPDPKLWFLTVFACFLIGALGGMDCHRKDTHRLAREMMQREAVIAGHAEWRPGTNGEPSFHWKDCP